MPAGIFTMPSGGVVGPAAGALGGELASAALAELGPRAAPLPATAAALGSLLPWAWAAAIPVEVAWAEAVPAVLELVPREHPASGAALRPIAQATAQRLLLGRAEGRNR